MDIDAETLKAFSYQDYRVRPKWTIRRSTEERFREFVAAKYGFMEKGMLGRELDIALNNHMRRFLKSRGLEVLEDIAHTHKNCSTNTNTNTNVNKAQQKTIQFRNLVVEYLIKQVPYYAELPIIRIGLPALSDAIRAVTALKDPRSIRNQIESLESMGLITKSKSSHVFYDIICSNDGQPKEDLR